MTYMYQTVKAVCLLVAGVLLSITAAGQDDKPVTLSPNMVVEESIAGSEVEKVATAARKILNEYTALGHIRNENGVPTQRVANDFQNLFKATATVFSDYLEYPGGTGEDIAEYRRILMEKFPNEGFPYDVSNAELSGVSGEGFRFFIAKIRFKKSIKKYVDGRGRIRDAAQDGSRDFILEMTVEISVDDLGLYKIREIVCADGCGRPAADRVRYLSGTLSIGLPLTSSDLLPITNVDMSATSAINFKHTLQASVGGRWTSNVLNPDAASNKNIFLTVGGELSFSRFSSQLRDYALLPIGEERFNGTTNEGEVAEYRRLVTNVTLDEDVSMVSLDLPFGLSYRILNDYDRAFMIDFLARPTLTVSKSISLSRAEGRYDGVIPEANFSVLENYPRPLDQPGGIPENPILDPTNNPFNACECDLLTRTESELATGLGLWLQISPTYYTNLDNDDPALGLQFSLDLAYNISSPITSSAASDAYYRDPRGEEGVLANGYFKHGLHYIGIRVGVYLHKVTSVNIR